MRRSLVCLIFIAKYKVERFEGRKKERKKGLMLTVLSVFLTNPTGSGWFFYNLCLDQTRFKLKLHWGFFFPFLEEIYLETIKCENNSSFKSIRPLNAEKTSSPFRDTVKPLFGGQLKEIRKACIRSDCYWSDVVNGFVVISIPEGCKICV